MKVYVAEAGEYSQRGVCGVFASVEAAIAEFGGTWKRELWPTWQPWEFWESWTNGDVTLSEYDVSEGGDIGVSQIIVGVEVDGRLRHHCAVTSVEADQLMAAHGKPEVMRLIKSLGLLERKGV